MDKKRKAVIASNRISRLETVTLGGYEQKILLEGKEETLPILIMLHGGPGTPIPFCEGCRGLFPELTERFILVYWDQYGCGINQSALPEDITIDDFCDMTCDLIAAVQERFPANKRYLFAMSWGSVLAAKVIQKKVAQVDGVLAYGQVLSHLMQTEGTIQAILQSNAPRKVKEDVRNIMESQDFSSKNSMKMSRYVRKYTEGYTNRREPKAPVGGMIKGILTSPDYRFRDFMAIVVNGYMKNQSLIDELAHIDLQKDLAGVSVPYRILQGDTDVVTDTGLIKQFVEDAKNPNLSCRVVKDAAHMPGMNGMRAIQEELDGLRL